MRQRIFALMFIGAMICVPSTFGGQPATQTLTPPPPSFETCKAVGGGTICSGSRGR